MNILIIGCGYVGHRAALSWIDSGHSVTALTRSEVRAKEWEQQGITAVIGDVLSVDSLKDLPAADLCLYAVGYDRSAAPDKRDVYVHGVRNVLCEIKDCIPKLIYISSSSVYGQSHGEWVNEDSACEPTSDGGLICLEAESVVRELYPAQATILRLSGIYGPGRLIARADQLKQQTPLTGNPDAWLNLVHIDDIINAISRLSTTNAPAALYLLSDSQPITRREFYASMAKLVGAPPPVFTPDEDAVLNKRCDSIKIQTELRLKLLYPDIHSGLPQALGMT